MELAELYSGATSSGVVNTYDNGIDGADAGRIIQVGAFGTRTYL